MGVIQNSGMARTIGTPAVMHSLSLFGYIPLRSFEVPLFCITPLKRVLFAPILRNIENAQTLSADNLCPQEHLHPGKLTWNLKITQLKRKIIWTKLPFLDISMLVFRGKICKKRPFFYTKTPECVTRFPCSRPLAAKFWCTMLSLQRCQKTPKKCQILSSEKKKVFFGLDVLRKYLFL